MLAKRKVPEPPAEGEEEEIREVEVLVDPMTTSLGEEVDLIPQPGPPVPREVAPVLDERPLFVCLSLYTRGLMPSEALQAQYYDWLRGDDGEEEDGSVSDRAPGITMCLAQYALCVDTFEDNDENPEEQYADAMSEEELLAAEKAEEEMVDEQGDATPPIEMMRLALPFVVGNCHVVKAESRDAVLEWLQAAPSTTHHRATEWLPSLLTAHCSRLTAHYSLRSVVCCSSRRHDGRRPLMPTVAAHRLRATAVRPSQQVKQARRNDDPSAPHQP